MYIHVYMYLFCTPSPQCVLCQLAIIGRCGLYTSNSPSPSSYLCLHSVFVVIAYLASDRCTCNCILRQDSMHGTYHLHTHTGPQGITSFTCETHSICVLNTCCCVAHACQKCVSNKQVCYMCTCTCANFAVSRVMLMALLGCLRRQGSRRTGMLPHCAKNHTYL